MNRNGRRTPLLDERRGFRLPRISPDGRHVAVVIDPRPSQVWVYDIPRRSGIPISTEGHNLGGVWTPDGQRVTYSSNGDVYWRPADGSAAAERLFARNGAQYAQQWTRDGQVLVFREEHPTNRSDIWILPRTGDPRPLIATSAHELSASLSPDERWLAYQSNESGRQEIYVRPFPNVDDGKWTVSTRGGLSPVWSPTGRELFYLNGISPHHLTIHADRGAPMRSKLVALLFSDLGIAASHSRPRVSNDNPFSEAQFRTLKYRPAFPDRFGSLEHARGVSRDLFSWYNDAHHHSGLTYLTPADVHHGRAAMVLAGRHRTRLAAYAAHPERFVTGPPRPDTLPTAVWINRPPTPASQDAPATTILTPHDPQPGVICQPPPISDDRSVTPATSVESLQ